MLFSYEMLSRTLVHKQIVFTDSLNTYPRVYIASHPVIVLNLELILQDVQPQNWLPLDAAIVFLTRDLFYLEY